MTWPEKNWAFEVKYSLKFTKGFNEVRKEIWETSNVITASKKIVALWREFGSFKKGETKEYPPKWFYYKIGWIIDE